MFLLSHSVITISTNLLFSLVIYLMTYTNTLFNFLQSSFNTRPICSDGVCLLVNTYYLLSYLLTYLSTLEQ